VPKYSVMHTTSRKTLLHPRMAWHYTKMSSSIRVILIEPRLKQNQYSNLVLSPK
jgi:hypothetical protein